MKAGNALARRMAAPVVGVSILAGLFFMSQSPAPSSEARAALASRFSFSKIPLPRPAGASDQFVRSVSPSLSHLSAWISSVGAAVALADIDGDGLPNDSCFVDTRTNRVIVAMVPGSENRARPYAPFALDLSQVGANETVAPMGCLPGNFKEDANTDVLVYFWGRTPVIFLHVPNVGGTLTAASFIPQEIVPGGERWYSNSAMQADLDGDGHPDIIIGNYFPDGAHILDRDSDVTDSMQNSMSYALNGGGPRILLWSGLTGSARPVVRYRDVTDSLPQETRHGWTLALGAADLEGRQLPSLYLANDFGPDRLFLNRSTPGHPAFSLLRGSRSFLVPKSKTLGADSFKGMGVDFADMRARGLFDIAVSNITETYALQESNFVFVNTGDVHAWSRGVAPFRDESERLGLARGGWAWDVKFGDFDNSGQLEILQATGFVRGQVNRWPELQELAMGNDQFLRHPTAWLRVQPGDDLSGGDPNHFFVRDETGRYVDIAPDLGLDAQGPKLPSRGVAIADCFGNGRLDFAIANQWGETIFYRNAAPTSNAFIGLHLRIPIYPVLDLLVIPGNPAGAPPSRPAIGATALAFLPDGSRRIAQVDGGNGHSGKNAPDIFFGLGPVTDKQTIPIQLQWREPGGRAVKRTIRVTPGWHTVILGGNMEL